MTERCRNGGGGKYHKKVKASEQIVRVHFDPATYSLTVERPRYTVLPGDVVIWLFSGLPEAWSPWIFLEGQRELTLFEGLTQGVQAVWGRLREDVSATSIVYRASAQRGLGKPPEEHFGWIQSPQARLDLKDRGDACRHVFQVRPTENDGELTVVPLSHQIGPGDTVEWYFEKGDLEELSPRIDFKDYCGDMSPKNQQLGPFTSLTYEQDRVIGKGSSGIKGRFYFRAALTGLVDSSLLWVSSVDPFVDDKSDPGDPGSG